MLHNLSLCQLVEQINQVSEDDTVVPALCVFLLGICYEFNRQPGEITRSIPFRHIVYVLTHFHRTTIAPILNRLGVDTLVGRMIRIREDDRFKSTTPDSMAVGEKAEVWFEWSFVDFWKSNYCALHRRCGRPQLSLNAKIRSKEGFPQNRTSWPQRVVGVPLSRTKLKS